MRFSLIQGRGTVICGLFLSKERREKMRKKLFVLLLAGITCQGLLTGCGSSDKGGEEVQEAASNTGTEEESDPDEQAENAGDSEETDELKTASEAEIDGELLITIGDHQTDQYIWKIASAKGFFEEEFDEDNISVEIQTFSGGPQVFEALAAGGIQFGIGGLDPLINYSASGADISCVAEFAVNDHSYPFVARTDLGIENVTDLKGHSVAVTIGSYRHNAFLTALQENGMTEEDVEIFNLSNADIVTAILAGEADAGVISLANYEKVKDVAEIIDYAEEYKTSHNIIAADNSFTAQYPYTTARVLRVAKKSIDWLLENREEAMEIFAEAVSLPTVEDAASYYDTMNFDLTLDADVIKADLKSTIEFDLENDILTEDLDVEPLVDDTYYKLAGF